MIFRKVVLCAIILSIAFSCIVFAVPSVIDVADNEAENVFDGYLQFFGENIVTLDIGERQSESNVRYAEIDGVQKEIAENNNKYVVSLSDENMLVEITEKANEETSKVVKTQYFFIDVENKTARKLLSEAIASKKPYTSDLTEKSSL